MEIPEAKLPGWRNLVLETHRLGDSLISAAGLVTGEATAARMAEVASGWHERTGLLYRSAVYVLESGLGKQAASTHLETMLAGLAYHQINDSDSEFNEFAEAARDFVRSFDDVNSASVPLGVFLLQRALVIMVSQPEVFASKVATAQLIIASNSSRPSRDASTNPGSGIGCGLILITLAVGLVWSIT